MIIYLGNKLCLHLFDCVEGHIPETDQSTSISTVWSGYPEWMAGCLARLYQSEDLCDVTLDVGLRTVQDKTYQPVKSMCQFKFLDNCSDHFSFLYSNSNYLGFWRNQR